MNTAAYRLARTHRRLTVAMALSALIAFAAGAGLPAPITGATGALLLLGFFWQPAPELSQRIERAVLVITALLVIWAFYQIFVVTDDIVAPVVALLLVLLTGEALRSLDARNDVRLYTLSFALLVAATAYLPGFVFAIAFVAFVLLTTFALMVGYIRRESERHAIAQPGLDRTMLRIVVALSVITLGMGAFVFAAFPRLPRNIFGRGIAQAGVQMAGFGDEVSIGEYGSRIYANPEIVLRVEFPAGDSTLRPTPLQINSMYWRGRSFDEFDGVRWSRNTRRMPRAWAPADWYRSWGAAGVSRQADQRVYAGALDARVLFGLHPVLEVVPRSDFRPIMDAVGDMFYVTGGSPVYVTRSGWEAPSLERLRAAEPGPAPSAPPIARTLRERLDQVVLQYYLQLPPLPARVRALADSLTAGKPTQLDRVLAIQGWLQSNFSYTLDLPATRQQATLDHFLFERRAGHCEYFSTGLAVLLRSVGIPARNVNGFLGGDWNELGGYLAVTQNDAHSWVEVWFSGIGWVPFDATPAGGTAGLADQSDLFGPFRYLFNGIQHRWSKWVIDYNLDRQIELFSGIGELFSRERAPQKAQPDDERPGLSLRVLAFAGAAAGVLFVLLRVLRRRRARERPETRLYLHLRRVYARGGWDDGALASRPRKERHGGVARRERTASLTALEWVDALQRAGAPAAGVAERITRRYLEARYGGRALSGEEERSLAESLALVRASVRAHERG